MPDRTDEAERALAHCVATTDQEAAAHWSLDHGPRLLAIARAARALNSKMDAVQEAEGLVHMRAFGHGVEYEGPSIETELADLRRAVARNTTEVLDPDIVRRYHNDVLFHNLVSQAVKVMVGNSLSAADMYDAVMVADMMIDTQGMRPG